MKAPGNLFAGIPNALPDELIELLIAGDGLRVERIVSRGHASPPGFWYDQEWPEWVLLVTGAARLEFDDGTTLDMKPGSYVAIPAHRRHRVAWTSPDQDTLWLAVHFAK